MNFVQPLGGDSHQLMRKQPVDPALQSPCSCEATACATKIGELQRSDSTWFNNNLLDIYIIYNTYYIYIYIVHIYIILYIYTAENPDCNVEIMGRCSKTWPAHPSSHFSKHQAKSAVRRCRCPPPKCLAWSDGRQYLQWQEILPWLSSASVTITSRIHWEWWALYEVYSVYHVYLYTCLAPKWQFQVVVMNQWMEWSTKHKYVSESGVIPNW